MNIYFHDTSFALFVVLSIFSRAASLLAVRATASPTTVATRDLGLCMHDANYPPDDEESLEGRAGPRQDLSVSLVSPRTAFWPPTASPAIASEGRSRGDLFGAAQTVLSSSAAPGAVRTQGAVLRSLVLRVVEKPRGLGPPRVG